MGTSLVDRTRPLRRLLSRLEAAELRRFGTTGLAVLYRHPALLLTTTGRRSGRRHATPLAYTDDGAGRWLVSGGAGGQTRTPDWVANLRAHPAATVRIGRRGGDVQVTAVELTGDDRAAVWERLTDRWPALEAYERRAGRTVPVFRLEA